MCAKILSCMADNEALIKKVEEYEKSLKEPPKPKEKRKKAWKYILNITVVLLVTGLALFLTLKDNYNTIINYLMGSDYRYILLIVGIMVATILVRSFILFAFARLYTRDYHYYQALATEEIGQFYSAVTPGAAGGEVMQAYTFKKQGIPISTAVSALAMHSIIYQFVLILYGTVSLIFKWNSINDLGDLNIGRIGEWTIILPVWVLTIMGFVLNVSVIGLILMMGFWKKFHNFIMGPIVGFLAKIKIIKKPDKTRENLRVQVENFKIETRKLLSNIPFTILIAFCFALCITIKYSIPFWVGKAMGNQSTSASFWDAIFLSNYHQMVTGLIPVPGSAGVSEGFFAILFVNNGNSISPTNSFYYVEVLDEFGELDIGATKTASLSLCQACLLVWRSITFAFPIIVAGFVTAFYRASPKEEARNDRSIVGRQTIINLQKETLVERQEELETMLETQRLTRAEVMKKLRSFGKKDETKKKKKRRKRKTTKTSSNNEFDNVDIEQKDDSI